MQSAQWMTLITKVIFNLQILQIEYIEYIFDSQFKFGQVFLAVDCQIKIIPDDPNSDLSYDLNLAFWSDKGIAALT